MTLWLCLLCLLVGFLAGIALDDALDLYRQSREARKMNKPHIPNGRTVAWAGLVFAIVMQLVVGGALVKSRSDLEHAERERANYQACTTRWQQEFASAYKARVESSTEASAALENVVRAVDSEDPARFRLAVDDYLRLRDKQIDDQKKNPYPPLPDDLCGEKP